MPCKLILFVFKTFMPALSNTATICNAYARDSVSEVAPEFMSLPTNTVSFGASRKHSIKLPNSLPLICLSCILDFSSSNWVCNPRFVDRISSASFSAIPARSFAWPASFSATAVPYKEKGRQHISPAIPIIKSHSQNFFSFLRFVSGGKSSPTLSGKTRLKITSVSPPSATNTATLNPMSNQPQVGIELKKDIGFWIFAISCWSISLALIVFGTIRYTKK